MVESVGAKAPASGEVKVARVAAAAPSPAVASPTQTAGAKSDHATAVALSGIVQSMAAAPPVDAERVQRIKQAIATGTFPILPATIADRLMALKLEWHSDDEA